MELGPMNQQIVFKLLAVLRLSVDGHPEAACQIGSSKIIGRVVDWGAADSPPGIRTEATRLLAALIKNSHTKKVRSDFKMYSYFGTGLDILSAEDMVHLHPNHAYISFADHEEHH